MSIAETWGDLAIPEGSLVLHTDLEAEWKFERLSSQRFEATATCGRTSKVDPVQTPHGPEPRIPGCGPR
jgi:hypothetical protein